jgi:hypothetical protein
MGDINWMKCRAILSVLLVAFAANTFAFDDLTELSDEFDSASTLTNWHRIYQTEGWDNNALEHFDINTSRPGRMFMLPHTSSWYAEWRGELTYKTVTGDFVITTDVEPRSRSGTGAPQSLYSLAGIMVRAPRTMTHPNQWTPGGQNYVFLSLGAASDPGQFQFEVKTTENSQSTLHITPGVARAQIQVARLGGHFIMLRRNEGGSWTVHRRYSRPDMPATLQAGLTVYTDWSICEQVGVQFQNTNILTNGAQLPDGQTLSGCQPDLAASFDFVRYQRPNIPAALAGADFSNPQAVPDATLLSFLGANAMRPGGAALAPTIVINSENAVILSLNIATQTDRSYRVQTSPDLRSWANVTNFVSNSATFGMTNLAPAFPHHFFRVISP